MQKFGLDSLQSQKHSALELEIIKEQATALGMAGRKLRLVIQAFETAKAHSFPEDNMDLLIHEISESVYGLILQREFIGFIEGNMEWVRKYYRIPDEAVAIFGRNTEPKT